MAAVKPSTLIVANGKLSMASKDSSKIMTSRHSLCLWFEFSNNGYNYLLTLNLSNII